MPRPKGLPKTGGRQKGKPIVVAMRESVWNVYIELGGDPAMAAWAKENPTEFYKIAAKLMPAIDASHHEGDVNVLINVSDAKQSLAERISRRLIAQRTGDTLQ